MGAVLHSASVQPGHGSDRSLHGLEKFTTLKTTWIELA